jgi:hypothetical protein
MPQDKKKKSVVDKGIIDPFKLNQNLSQEEILDPFKQGVPSGIIDPFRQSLHDQTIERMKQGILETPGVQSTLSTIAPAFDFIVRPGMASARFVDALADESKGIFDAIAESWDELVGTQASGRRKRITFSDVIRRRYPDFAIDNPKAATTLGFVFDVAADPITYLGLGLAKSGITVGGRVLSKSAAEGLEAGIKAASRTVFVGKEGTLELVERFPKLVEKAARTERVLEKRIATAERKGIDEVLITQGQANRLLAKLNTERALTEQGYFNAVRGKQDEIERLLNQLAGDPTTSLAETIAKRETLRDLRRNAKSNLPDELMEDEIRERIGERILHLASLSPTQASKLLEPRGLYLKLGLPFSKQRDVMRLIGLEGISNRVKAISAYMEQIPYLRVIPATGSSIAGVFNRNFGLPDEYIKLRDELENELGYLTDSIVRDTRKLFKDFPKLEDRQRIGEAMHWIDDQSRLLEELRAAGKAAPSEEQFAQVVQRGMDKFKLNESARSVVVGLQQSYKEAALLEMRAGLLKNNLVNYSPRGYLLIENADDMSLITRGKHGSAVPQPYLSSSNQRKFLTKAEAEAAGLVPELDAAILYAHRVLSSQRALAIKQFKDSVTELFGAYTPRSTIAHTGILPTAVISKNLPDRVASDMRMIGESVLPSTLSPLSKTLLRRFDQAQTFTKRAATTARPSFAPKQVVSNTFQSAMIAGLRAFKALDPRVALDAATLLARFGKPFESIPPFLTNFISRHFTGNSGLDAVLANRVMLSRIFGEEAVGNYASQFRLVTTLGQEFTGTELVQLARQNGVIRGFDATGEAFSQKIGREITKDQNTFKNTVGALARVWNHASMIEDYSRMALFLNGIRMGYTAKDASKLVNKALFDYSRGLSSIERNVIKRIIPFYSFQRFAIPFVLKQGMKQPGNIATLQKMMGTFEKLLTTGEDLTDAEVNIFNETGNNVILDQPRLRTGFDGHGRTTLNVLNNLTPYDVLNFTVYDSLGDVDYRRSVEKSIAAAVTPFIKVPISWMVDRDFFTGKTIEQASKLGNLEGSLGKVIPNFAKELIGWETRQHKITGEITTYVSPWLAYYSMQFVPALKDVVNVFRDTDPLEQRGYVMGPTLAAMEMLVPASRQTKLDLKRMGEFSLLRKSKEIRELERGMAQAQVEGSQTTFNQRQGELLRHINILQENVKQRNGLIRGLGIGGLQGMTDDAIDQFDLSPTPLQQEFK